MTLYLVRTPWLANGNVSVFVEANDVTEAVDQAEAALVAEAEQSLTRYYRGHPPEWAVKHRTEQIESYRTRDGWQVGEVTLPFVTEIS